MIVVPTITVVIELHIIGPVSTFDRGDTTDHPNRQVSIVTMFLLLMHIPHPITNIELH
jgi:hypothetical protein